MIVPSAVSLSSTTSWLTMAGIIAVIAWGTRMSLMSWPRRKPTA